MSKPFAMTKAADVRLLRPEELHLVAGGDDAVGDGGGDLSAGGDDKWTIGGTIKIPFDLSDSSLDTGLTDDKVKLDARK